MKVLHVLDHSLPIGSGYSYRARNVVLQQKRLGLDPVVLTSPKQGTATDSEERIDEIMHYRTGCPATAPPFVRELALMRKLAARIARVVRQERISLIHAHSPLLNGLPALLVARALRVPVVYEVRTFWEDAAVSHGTFAESSLRYRISRALETIVLRRADRVVSICQGIRGEVLRRGVPAERVAVVPNGVDPIWFEPQPRATGLAERLGLGSGPVFSYIGSFNAYEGLPFLIDAARDFLRPFPDGRLLLVGSGKNEPAVREAMRTAGAAVQFLGRIPHSEVRELYSIVDILVLPRRRMRLTELVTPLKPLEAMANATSILASDVGGHAELITEGETGLLFNAESREALVAQAVRLGAEPELRRQIGARARAAAADRTWDRMVARYLPLYAGAR